MYLLKKKRGLYIILAIWAILWVSAAHGATLWTDGFESGDFSGGWDSYPGAVPVIVGTSAYGVTPHSGNYLAYTTLNYSSSHVIKNLDATKVSQFGGYMAIGNNPSHNGVIWTQDNSVGPGGRMQIWLLGDGTVKYTCGGADVNAGYQFTANPYEWVKVEFRHNANGKGLFFVNGEELPLPSWWNGCSSCEDFDFIGFGGAWAPGNVAYDDFWTADANGVTYTPSCEEAIRMGYGAPSDLDENCYVNIADLSLFAQDWLKNVDPGIKPPSTTIFPPVMKVDGEPFFPVGYFDHIGATSVPAYDIRYSAFKAQGTNTVLHWGSNWSSMWGFSVMATTSALNNGLKYIAGIHTFAVQGHDNATPPNPVPLSALDVLVDHLWNKEALIAWYLCDEPDISGVTPARLKEAYARVQERDLTAGAHPQLVVYSGDPSPYFAAEPPLSHDVTMFDSYPCNTANGGGEFSNPLYGVSVRTRSDRNLIKSYGNTKPQMNVTQATALNDGYHTPFRYPTYKEQRYLTFGPIVEGARGILWWDWGNANDQAYITARENYQAQILGPVATQIKAVIPAIISNVESIAVSSNRDTDTTGHGIQDVTYLFGEDSSYCYLIAVNHTNATIPSVTFTMTGTPLGTGPNPIAVNVIYEALAGVAYPDPNHPTHPSYTFTDRSVNRVWVSGNTWTMTDSFGPYDVNIYKLGSVVAPESCIQVLARGGTLGAADFNANCKINLQDFGVIAQDWLKCIDPDVPNCDKPWE